MESTQTAIVLDALVAALNLDGVEVVDGQPVKLDDPDVLVIGWSPAGPVTVAQERAGMGRDRRQEVVTVPCVASTWRGESTQAAAKVVRNAAVDILDRVRDRLDADRTLGGAVTRAVLGFEGTLDQAQTADGATATFDFTISVTTL
jgi:hypothetical protein